MPFSPIKKQIRARFGSIKAFEEAKGLRAFAVRDHLRGKSVSAAERAIIAEFGEHPLERPRLKRRRPAPAADNSSIPPQIAMALQEVVDAFERLRDALVEGGYPSAQTQLPDAR